VKRLLTTKLISIFGRDKGQFLTPERSNHLCSPTVLILIGYWCSYLEGKIGRGVERTTVHHLVLRLSTHIAIFIAGFHCHVNKTWLFCDVTQHILAVNYRSFGTTCQLNLQGLRRDR